MRAFPLIVPIVALSLLAGCSESNRQQEALDRIKNRPKPGYVRILNLRPEPATLLAGERPVNPSVKTGESGKLAPDGVGKRNLFLEYGGQKTKLDVELASGIGHTLVLLPGKHVLLGGEPVKPDQGKNLFVAFVGPEGPIASGKSVTVKTAEGDKTAKAGDGPMDVVSGPVSCLGKSFDLEPGMAYTLLIHVDGTSMKPYFMLNTANDRPAAAGTASS